MKECNYCGAEVEKGKICAKCADKLQLVRELMKRPQPLRILKAQRDAREYWRR